MTMSSLEERVERIESIFAVHQLMYDYCRHSDNGYDAEKIASLFTPDGVWDGQEFGAHHGHDAIVAHFKAIRDSFKFAAHLVVNPAVTFASPDEAEATYRLWEPASVLEDGVRRSKVALGGYRNTCVRTGDGWRLKKLGLYLNFFVNLEDGWSDVTHR